MTKKHFLWNTILSLAGFGILTGANFLYSIFTVRLLPPDAFSAYNTFFYFLLALPLPSFQLAVAKVTGRYSLSLRSHVLAIFPSLSRLALWSAVGYLVFSPLLWYLYGQQYPLLVPLGLLVLEGWIWLSGFRGMYQGILRFDIFALNMGIEGIFRLLVGAFALLLGLSVYGALSASMVSGIIGLIALLIPVALSPHDTTSSSVKETPPILASFFHALLMLLPFGLIVVLDQTMINRFLPSFGKIVNLSSLFGKNLITLSLTIAHVVFAYVIKEGEESFFLRGMGIIVALFGGAYVFAVLGGKWLFEFLFGSSGGYDFLPLYIGYCLPLGLLQLVVNYSVAEEHRWVIPCLWLYLIGMASFMMIFLHFFPSSLSFFYTLFGICHTLFVVILTGILVFFQKTSSHHPSS
ncbi:MAG: hypothetical protein N2314_02770 [Brevinematales bacterium]|nr:hypothetical protein [Brevinematales bacterium]